MLLSLYHAPSSPFQSPNTSNNGIHHHPLLRTPFLTPLITTATATATATLGGLLLLRVRPPHIGRVGVAVGPTTITSYLAGPPASALLLWAGRLCVFYALLRAGLAGSPSNPFTLPELGGGGAEGGDDLGFSKWIESFQGKSAEKEASDRRKLVSKWHPTTKGTLKRSYRVPSKVEGRRLLKAIAFLLSDDDHFIDATSHKGCQIRRESAHGESVCCNNVRALFDELPTPHLVVEITAFPTGPLTDKDYVKAEKLERVLRSGSSV